MNDDPIMVVEDEALIALDIEMTLMDSGFGNLSICTSVEAALRQIEIAPPRAALLDLNLGKGQTSIEIALRLKDLGCPFLFLTGYTKATADLPETLSDVRRLSKPFQNERLVREVGELVTGNTAE